MPMPFLGAREDGIAAHRADDGLDLLANALRIGRRQIDLVDDGNNFQVVIQRQVHIGQGLRFHALAASTTSRAPSQAGRLRETS